MPIENIIYSEFNFGNNFRIIKLFENLYIINAKINAMVKFSK